MTVTKGEVWHITERQREEFMFLSWALPKEALQKVTLLKKTLVQQPRT